MVSHSRRPTGNITVVNPVECLYDRLLKEEMTEGAKAIGFADDLVILVRARDREHR